MFISSFLQPLTGESGQDISCKILKQQAEFIILYFYLLVLEGLLGRRGCRVGAVALSGVIKAGGRNIRESPCA